MTFFTWLAGTKAGRVTMAIVAAVAAFFVAIFKAREAGKVAERSKQERASLDALRNRNQIDDDVSKTGDDAVRRELDDWRLHKTDDK